MFESKDDLKAEIKTLKSQLDIAKINIDASERARQCLSKELADALKTAADANGKLESMTSIRKELSAKLDESGIVEGRILRIEQAPIETAYDQGGLILTVRVSRPFPPRWWNPTDENGKSISVDDPANANHPKVKPILDKYRREMNEYRAFHVGMVYLRMPAVERE